MIPNKALVQPPQFSVYIPPDGDPVTATTDVSLGGINISDPSQGLEVQNWSGYVTNAGIPGSAVWLTAPSVPPVQLFTSNYITWMRFTFDQNMHPVVNFIDNNGSGYYWWDPTIPGTTIVYFPAGDNITYVACSLDDKRDLQTRLGTSDVIMGYVANNNLCYRQERDRYGIEYILYVNITNILANASIVKVGMNERYRLQFYLQGNLYQ